MLQAHCAVGCGFLSGLVFMNEVLRVYLVLKIVLMLYRVSKRLNFSETPFTYGIYTVPRDDCFPWDNNRVNETSGIIVQLKIRFEDSNYITQIFADVAYWGDPELYLFSRAANGYHWSWGISPYELAALVRTKKRSLFTVKALLVLKSILNYARFTAKIILSEL
jgi:hypothetical protein